MHLEIEQGICLGRTMQNGCKQACSAGFDVIAVMQLTGYHGYHT